MGRDTSGFDTAPEANARCLLNRGDALHRAWPCCDDLAYVDCARGGVGGRLLCTPTPLVCAVTLHLTSVAARNFPSSSPRAQRNLASPGGNFGLQRSWYVVGDSDGSEYVVFWVVMSLRRWNVLSKSTALTRTLRQAGQSRGWGGGGLCASAKVARVRRVLN